MGGPLVEFHCEVENGVVFVVVEGEKLGVRSVEGTVGVGSGHGV